MSYSVLLRNILFVENSSLCRRLLWYTKNIKTMHNPPLILLVDDEAQIRDLYAIKLQGAGFEVIQAINGLSGYQQAKEKKPDLIMLDMRMPIMDGAETIAKLKEDAETKPIKVIFLTALSDKPEFIDSDVKVAKDVGAADYFKKDIDLDEMVKRVKGHLGLA
jgi:DNA-binding response OmpR family regulator